MKVWEFLNRNLEPDEALLAGMIASGAKSIRSELVKVCFRHFFGRDAAEAEAKLPQVLAKSQSVKWYTPDDLVKRTGFNYEAITKWMREGKIPARKTGRRWKMTQEEFEKFMRNPPQLTSKRPRCTD